MHTYSLNHFDMYFFWRIIYFRLSIHTIFKLFGIPVNFLIWSVRFLKVCNEIILQSTSEVCIRSLTITLITLIIKVAWIEGWFLIALLFSLFLKEFLGWVWTFTVTAHLLSKIFSLTIYYWIAQIQFSSQIQI